MSCEIPFAKFHGLGNDFILLSATSFLRHGKAWQPVYIGLGEEGVRTTRLVDASTLARSICHRNTGIGADGLLVMLPPRDNWHQGLMLVFNADGSEAEMSGNGIRCAAAYIVDSARQRAESLRELRIETAAGVKSLLVVEAEERRWVFRVAMGGPVLQAEKIPFTGSAGHSPLIEFPLDTSRGILKVTVTSMGNPHCTVPVSDFDALDWVSLGREIETSELFPNRTNVEFVRVVSRDEIEVRFWERGVGKTQSSGTGSCAAVVACLLNGLTNREVRVRTLAGTLDVEWPEGKEVTLTGPVELIARGTYYFSDRRDR